MIKNVKPMGCGNCGHGLFRMYQQMKKSGGFKLIAECNSCKSTSVIEVTKPELQIEFGEGSDGCLCDIKPTF